MKLSFIMMTLIGFCALFISVYAQEDDDFIFEELGDGNFILIDWEDFRAYHEISEEYNFPEVDSLGGELYEDWEEFPPLGELYEIYDVY